MVTINNVEEKRTGRYIELVDWKWPTHHHHHHQPVMPLLADGLHIFLHSSWFWALWVHVLPASCSMSSLHLLFGLPFPLFLSHGVHSFVFLAHSWFVIRAKCPAHLPLASITFSMTSFTPVLDLKSLFPILSLLVTPSIDRSMLLWVMAY